MNVRNLAPLLRSARYLRTSQLLWRLRRLVERGLSSGRLRRPPFDSPRDALRPGPTPAVPLLHTPSPGGSEAVARLRRGEFHHLGRGESLGRGGTDWRLGPSGSGRLWTVTLHYHAWAYDLARAAAAGEPEAADLFRDYISDWIDRCTPPLPGTLDLAWNPYAIATRIGWWIRSYLALGEGHWRGWGSFHGSFLQSLWQQAAYLQDHLEWDLRGNHLLRDAVGLAWAGRFLQGEEAQRWLATATDLGTRQVEEQVLSDGGHFERSPMYHILVMEDVLSLTLLLESKGARRLLREAWKRMADFLVWMRHPDGEIPLLNDAALETACDPEHLFDLGESIRVTVDHRPPAGGRHFEETGLVVWHGDPWSVFFDAGPLGPDYQPGHAHADTLTLECSFDGERLIVDPGTYAYDRDERREYDRSTEAHNTVCIDGRNSSEVWHIFRVGRRARIRPLRVEFTDRAVIATAGHDGYDFLPGRPRHERRLEALDGGELTLLDRIAGRGSHEIRGGLLLAPGWTVEPSGEGWCLAKGTRKVRVEMSGPAEIRRFEDRRRYHPGFGQEIETTRLGWSLQGTLPLEIRTVLERA